MRKTIAIIGAGYLQQPLVEKAHEMGLRTICFAWAEGAVCRDLCDVFYPISIVEKEEILRICRREHIDGVCTIASDVAAPTVAYVAEQMHLRANNYAAAVRANNKAMMREAFASAGVPCPRFACVSSYAECLAMPWLNGPVIVKPTDRSGSLGVSKVENPSDLQSAVEQAVDFSFRKQAMIEEYIEGREISVEFISYGGEHYPLQITDKVTTEAPHFVELAHHQPSTLSAEMYENIYAITRRALDALGLTDGASHSEYKITSEGRIAIMEIGGRMGGDFIGSDLVRLSTGYDFVRGVIEVALGMFVAPSLSGYASLHQCSGVYFLCRETESILPTIQHAIAHPQLCPDVYRAEIQDAELRSVTCSADRSGYLIYQSDKRLEL